jgi:phospholipid/cholesterol/gamma-HCH transport system substrate-binding protein
MANALRARSEQGGKTMETDKHYFIEGLFIIGLSVAALLFSMWLVTSGHRDDVTYRIHFSESVSGLALGDVVKYRGVDVGTVKAMALDPEDPRQVQVDVRLRKDAPIKTDTKATLKIKGITGTVFIELTGGSTNAQSLIAATPEGQLPEIASEKSSLATILDELPKVIAKFSSIEDKTNKVVSDVSGLTSKIKENPSLLIWPSKEKSADKSMPEKQASAPAKR